MQKLSIHIILGEKIYNLYGYIILSLRLSLRKPFQLANAVCGGYHAPTYLTYLIYTTESYMDWSSEIQVLQTVYRWSF